MGSEMCIRDSQYAVAKKVSGDSEVLENFRQTSLDYVRDTVAKFRAEETPQAFEDIGITVIHGQASFKDKRSVVVNDQIYYYKNAIIATGSSPRTIDMPDLADEDVLTNQNLFQLESIPEQLLIIGAGGIGLEMAYAFSVLGSQVPNLSLIHISEPTRPY